MCKILVVEDERIAAEDIRLRLENLGYKVSAVISSGKAAIEKAEMLQPDLVLMDIKLRGQMNGIESAEEIRKRFDIPIVYLTAFADKDTLERIKHSEPYGFILKPFEVSELHGVIETALYKYKMEKIIRDNEAWLSTTLKSIGDAVITTDNQGIVTFINPVAEKLTGWSHEGAKGKPLRQIFKIVNEETRKVVENPVEKVLREGRIVGLANHTILISKDGTEIPIDDSGSPIRDEKGNINGVVLVFKDITERRRIEVQRKQTEIELRQSEEKYRSLVDTHQNPIYLLDENLQYLFANQIYLSRLNVQDKSQIIGHAYHEFHSINNTESFHKKVKKVFRSGIPLSYEYKSDRDGKYFVRTLSPVKDPVTEKPTAVTVISTFTPLKETEISDRYRETALKGKSWHTEQVDYKDYEISGAFDVYAFQTKPGALAALFLDITDRKKTEEALKRSEEQIRVILNSMKDGIHVIDCDFKIILFNQAFQEWNRLLGFKTDVTGKNLFDVFPFLKENIRKEYLKVFQDGKTLITEESTLIGGKEYITETRKIPVFNKKQVSRVITVIRDISERKQAEQQIQKDLKEKEVLLKEIHHRVKNNLQIISSLLNLQSRYVQDKNILKMFKESQYRVHSMALIHENLYQSSSLAKVDFSHYVRNVIQDLYRSYGVNEDMIELKINMINVSLSVNFAVPCGLIINELISNSLKYAFPKPFSKKGRIEVKLYPVGKDDLELVVLDNGIGLPKNFSLEKAKSLGLHLVAILAEDQLGGTLKVINKTGTQYKIRFKQK